MLLMWAALRQSKARRLLFKIATEEIDGRAEYEVIVFLVSIVPVSSVVFVLQTRAAEMERSLRHA